MKSKAIVYPFEYIGETGEVIKTLMTARDKNSNLFVICKTEDDLTIIIEEEDLLTNYDIAHEGIKIETPENEVHRDEEFDAFKAFQEGVKNEIGEMNLSE